MRFRLRPNSSRLCCKGNGGGPQSKRCSSKDLLLIALFRQLLLPPFIFRFVCDVTKWSTILLAEPDCSTRTLRFQIKNAVEEPLASRKIYPFRWVNQTWFGNFVSFGTDCSLADGSISIRIGAVQIIRYRVESRSIEPVQSIPPLLRAARHPMECISWAGQFGECKNWARGRWPMPTLDLCRDTCDRSRAKFGYQVRLCRFVLRAPQEQNSFHRRTQLKPTRRHFLRAGTRQVLGTKSCPIHDEFILCIRIISLLGARSRWAAPFIKPTCMSKNLVKNKKDI